MCAKLDYFAFISRELQCVGQCTFHNQNLMRSSVSKNIGNRLTYNRDLREGGHVLVGKYW